MFEKIYFIKTLYNYIEGIYFIKNIKNSYSNNILLMFETSLFTFILNKYHSSQDSLFFFFYLFNF
jgi:hypothetical protein